MHGYWVRQEETVVASIFAYYRVSAYHKLKAPRTRDVCGARTKFKVTKEVTVAKSLGLTCERQRRAVGITAAVEPVVVPVPRTVIPTIEVQGTTVAIGVPQGGAEKFEPGNPESIEQPTKRRLSSLFVESLTDASIGLDRFDDESSAFDFASDDRLCTLKTSQEIGLFRKKGEVRFREGEGASVLFLITFQAFTCQVTLPDRPTAADELGRVKRFGKDERTGGRSDNNRCRFGFRRHLVSIDQGRQQSVEPCGWQVEDELKPILVPTLSLSSGKGEGRELAVLVFGGLSHGIVWVTKSFKLIRSRNRMSWKTTYLFECFSPQHPITQLD